MFFFTLRSSFVHVHKVKCFFSQIFFSVICQKPKKERKRLITGWIMGTKHPFFSSRKVKEKIKGQFSIYLRSFAVLNFVHRLFFFLFSFQVSASERQKTREIEVHPEAITQTFINKKKRICIKPYLPFPRRLMESAHIWVLLLRLPKALAPTLVGTKLLLPIPPDRLRKSARRWVTHVAVLQARFCVVTLLQDSKRRLARRHHATSQHHNTPAVRQI